MDSCAIKKKETWSSAKYYPSQFRNILFNVRDKPKKGTLSETESYSDEGEIERVHNYRAVKTYIETARARARACVCVCVCV